PPACAKALPAAGHPEFQSLERAEHSPLTPTTRRYLHPQSYLPLLAQSTRRPLIPSKFRDKNTDVHCTPPLGPNSVTLRLRTSPRKPLCRNQSVLQQSGASVSPESATTEVPIKTAAR